jgi:uncharacterized protein YaiL (DUF2058 family)
MSSSLREQLLKAGLVTEKQARASQQQQQKQRPPSRHSPPANATPTQANQAQAAKVTRDQQLNKQRQQAAAAKARAVEVKQLIEQHRLPKILEGEDRFNFLDGKKLRFILVDAAMRQGLNEGRLVIVRYGGRSEVVPAAIGERIREREERAVIKLNEPSASGAADDAYKDFVVPDDLTW